MNTGYGAGPLVTSPGLGSLPLPGGGSFGVAVERVTVTYYDSKSQWKERGGRRGMKI